MRIPKLLSNSARFMFPLALAALLVLPACSINVKKSDNGEDKKVDINTPLGGIHVNNDADVRDTGLPVYPGARPKLKEREGDEKSANVDISSFGYSLKVVAVEYESDDPPSKIVAFYQDALKKAYGNVLQCRSEGHDYHYNPGDSHQAKELKCEGDGNGKNIELKVGTEDNQHIVSIQPETKGSSFALVYVRTKGKEGSI
jgi:hypothetical protein